MSRDHLFQVGLTETSPSLDDRREKNNSSDQSILMPKNSIGAAPSVAAATPVSAKKGLIRIGGASLKEIVTLSYETFERQYNSNTGEFATHSQELLEALVMNPKAASKKKLMLTLKLPGCSLKFISNKPYRELSKLNLNIARLIKTQLEEDGLNIGAGLTELIETKSSTLIPARSKYPKIDGQSLVVIFRKSNAKMKEFLEERSSEAETHCQELLEALIRDGYKCTLEKLEHLVGMGKCDLNFIRTQTVEYLQHLSLSAAKYIENRLMEADPFQDIGDGLRQLIKMHKEGEIKNVNSRRVITTSVETSPSPHNVKQQAMSSIRSSATPEDSSVAAACT